MLYYDPVARLSKDFSRTLVVCVSSELRRIFVGDLQAKAARFSEVRAQLLRAATFAFAVVVALLDAGRMELVHNRVEIVIGDVESKMAPAISGLCHFAEFAYTIEHHALP